MKSLRAIRWGGGAALAAALVLASATPSFAPHIAQLQISPAQAKAGDEVTVFGPRGYGRTNKVDVRWGSADGPILGSFQPNEELYATWGPGTVRIPADAKPGVYLLVATQTLTGAETHIRGVPARGELTVVGTGGVPAIGAAQGAQLTQQTGSPLAEEDPVSTGSVLLVALGVGGIGLLIAGAAAALASRRRQSPEPARASSSGTPASKK